ncbi:MAG: hypothetical protein L0Z62_06775 [Gemmataceae bacterium]|nr:hypothetical protein [Gemmataceae bacterium]
MTDPRKRWAGPLALLLIWPGLAAADVGPLLARIKAVGKEGAGNVEAARAWQELTARGPEALTDILAALGDANPVAANYLRSAIEAIADKALTSGKTLPAKQLEAFVLDKRHSGPARRLAYDYLVRIEPKTADRLLPGMLDDPGAELRRDAVAVVLREAKTRLDKDDRDGARTSYQKALKHACDRDQVQLVARQLKELGVEVDLTKQFGYITSWMVIGPFDNSRGAGYHETYPPEKGIDLKAEYTGKEGAKVRWIEHTTAKPLGEVDFNKIFDEQKGVVAYAWTAVESPSARPVEIRALSNNAVRIYLNGKEVFKREEYHHGTRMDQHVGRATLKAGRNEILVKICQNEQTEDWARLWHFQLRVCDGIGGAVPLTVITGKGARNKGEK